MMTDKPIENEITAHIRLAKNGVVVNACGPDGDETYVYKTLDEAIKDLKSIFSVAQQTEKKGATMQDVNDMEDKINADQAANAEEE